MITVSSHSGNYTSSNFSGRDRGTLLLFISLMLTWLVSTVIDDIPIKGTIIQKGFHIVLKHFKVLGFSPTTFLTLITTLLTKLW